MLTPVLSKSIARYGFRTFNRFNSTLVVVEHKKGKVASSTLNAVTAAKKLGHPVTLLAATSADAKAKLTETLSKLPVAAVLLSSNDAFKSQLSENLAPVVQKVVKEKGFKNVVFSHSAFGKDLAPRVAALLDVAQISDIVQISSADTFVRPIYAGNALETVKAKEDVKVLTFRGSSFAAAELKSGAFTGKVEEVSPAAISDKIQWIKEEVSQSDRPELGSAKRVISGGRGLKNGDNFKMLYDLADKIGAAVGGNSVLVYFY